MMASEISRSIFSKDCEISIPDPTTNADQFVSRWSKVSIQSVPAAVIVPATEEDIAKAISYARENGLKLIPTGGTHGPFVPVDSGSVYMDMRQFKTIQLDEDSATVTVGGGAITGDVVRALAERGFYTSKVSKAFGRFSFYVFGCLRVPTIHRFPQL
jgi:FAD/FMN-containing dehydrogenase